MFYLNLKENGKNYKNQFKYIGLFIIIYGDLVSQSFMRF
jgi:hypothetical protein